MTKINQIQQAIIALSPGAYQKLMDEYLIKRFNFDNYTPYGSHTGTDKTTPGTPDSYVNCANGKKILIQHGSVGKAFPKVREDLLDCRNPEKTGIPVEQIEQIICCHTSTNFSPGQTAELESLFENVTVISLGDVSHDLLRKYPSIALDHLGISLDTHQFFDLDGFIKEYAKNAYSTSLDMPLLGRENELEILTGLIASENVVMLYGASGIGKTRLAIEAAKQYANSREAKLLVLKGNGESILNDCSFYIDDEKENVIVIDDANHLPQIQHLLGIAEDKERPYPLKLVLTVRDYIRQDLSKQVNTISKPKTLELKPLSNNSIEKILWEIFHIENYELIRHILRIAKGNARLAVMAAKCVIDKNFEAVKNASELFNEYYSPIISQMNQDEITVAFLVAFFDDFKLNESALAVKIAQDKGISYSEVIDHCKRLHNAEVINLLDNRAVRFDNQNLRDYLLNYCLLQEKTITPSELIAYAFPKHKDRVVFAFTTLLNLFRTTERVDYLTLEVHSAWNSVRLHDDESVLSFINAFCPLIPDESLLFIKKKIDTLPELHSEIDISNIPKQSGFRSPLVEILASFYDSNLFEDAMSLVFRHLECNTENIGDFCLLFSESWGINYKAHLLNFSHTLKVIERLLAHYQHFPSNQSAVLLYSFINKNFEGRFSDIILNDDDSFRPVNIMLPSIDAIYQIRKLCLQGLAELMNIPDYQMLADEILGDLFQRCATCDKEVLHSDMQNIAAIFSPILHADNYTHCFYLRQIHLICEESGISYPASLEKYSSNRIFSRFSILSENYISRYHKLEDYKQIEACHYQDIENLCDTTSLEEFSELWEALSSPPLNDSKFSYDIGRSIHLVFQYLQHDWDRFIGCAEAYINADTPFGFSCYSLIDALIKKWGYVKSERYLQSFSFRYKNKWIADIQNSIPQDKMNLGDCERIMDFASQPDDTFVPVYYETAMKAEHVSPGFMAKYLSLLNQKAVLRPYELSNFLRPLTAKNHADPKELIFLLKGSEEVLFDSYLLALHGQPHFDSDGCILHALIVHSKQFLSVVVPHLLTSNHDNFSISTLSTLWNAENYMELVTETIESMRATDRRSCYSLGKVFICDPLGKQDKCDFVLKWINHYIIEYCTDMDRMNYLFHILCGCPKTVYKQALIRFCKSNSSYDDFISLPLDALPQIWSRSKSSSINSQLDFWEGLKQELSGIDFIEHRAHISAVIQSIRSYKSRTEAEDFIERL